MAMTSKDEAGRPQFVEGPLVRNPKVAEQVALRILRSISDAAMKPGDSLPTEANMQALYQVSRGSLREALRLLEVQGLITMRPGPRGGAFVGEPRPSYLGRTLTLYFDAASATYDELLDTWHLIEPLLAREAALNPDRELVEKLMIPFLDDHHGCSHQKTIEAGYDFHHAVSQLASNKVLRLISASLEMLVGDHILASTNREKLEDDLIDDHQRLAEAIIAGKAEDASRLMHEHLGNVLAQFRTLFPRQVGESIVWR